MHNSPSLFLCRSHHKVARLISGLLLLIGCPNQVEARLARKPQGVVAGGCGQVVSGGVCRHQRRLGARAVLEEPSTALWAAQEVEHTIWRRPQSFDDADDADVEPCALAHLWVPAVDMNACCRFVTEERGKRGNRAI